MSDTASEAKHTPTPWSVRPAKGHRIDDIVDANSKHIVSFDGEPFEQQQADAAFVVRAVNSHDALVEMVKLFEKTAEYEIRRDKDQESRGMKTITLNLIREALKLAGAS